MNIQTHENLANYYRKAHEAALARDSSFTDHNESCSGSDCKVNMADYNTNDKIEGNTGHQSQRQQMTLANSDSANYIYPFSSIINPSNLDLTYLSLLSLENKTGRGKLKIVGSQNQEQKFRTISTPGIS